MKILALDTSNDACSAALLYQNTIIERNALAPRQHTQLILPMLESLLSEAGIKLADLDALAFACGPGSFTGVRIAAAVTQGLAFANDLPVIPISTLCGLAQGAYKEFNRQQVLVAVDARMHEIYWGEFEVNAMGIMEPSAKEAIISPQNVSKTAAGSWYGVGSGWQLYADILLPKTGLLMQNICFDYYPHAKYILELAKHVFQQGRFVTAENAVPVYLRDKVV